MRQTKEWDPISFVNYYIYSLEFRVHSTNKKQHALQYHQKIPEHSMKTVTKSTKITFKNYFQNRIFHFGIQKL